MLNRPTARPAPHPSQARYLPDPPLVAWRRAVRRRATILARRAAGVVTRRGTLSIVGLGCIAGACFTFGLFAGLVAVGVVLLVIDGRILQ